MNSKPAGYYRKNGKTRPITKRKVGTGTYQTNTAHLSVPKGISEKPKNLISDTDLLNLVSMLPTSPLIKAGWLLLNNIDFEKLDNVIASNEPIEQRMARIEHMLEAVAKQQAENEIMNMISPLMIVLRKEIGSNVDFIVKELDKNPKPNDFKSYWGFVKGSLAKLIVGQAPLSSIVEKRVEIILKAIKISIVEKTLLNFYIDSFMGKQPPIRKSSLIEKINKVSAKELDKVLLEKEDKMYFEQLENIIKIVYR
jgi:hypothetical protein